MKYFIFHIRTPFRIIHLILTIIFTIVAVKYLIIDPTGFGTKFDYKLGWFCYFVLVVIPQCALIIESVKDWKKK